MFFGRVICFSMMSRCIEALARAGEYDRAMLNRAVAMFEVRIIRFWISS